MILFDTSVLSRVFRRARVGPQERELVATFDALMRDDEPLGLPGIVLQEALSGVKAERAFRELRSRLLGAFTILPASVADNLEAARIRNRCAARGMNASGV